MISKSCTIIQLILNLANYMRKSHHKKTSQYLALTVPIYLRHIYTIIFYLYLDFLYIVSIHNTLTHEFSSHQDTSNRNRVYNGNIAYGYSLHFFLCKYCILGTAKYNKYKKLILRKEKLSD